MRYSVLSFQPSSRDPNRTIPLAVIVQGEGPTPLFIVGRHLEGPEGVSGFGRSVLENLPDTIVKQVNEAIESGVDDILKHLVELHQWSIFASEPVEVEDGSAGVQGAAWRLFGELVAKDLDAPPGIRETRVFYDEPQVRHQAAV